MVGMGADAVFVVFLVLARSIHLIKYIYEMSLCNILTSFKSVIVSDFSRGCCESTVVSYVYGKLFLFGKGTHVFTLSG